MKKFTIRRAEDGRLKAAQIVGNTRIGGVVSCVLNYYKFMDRSRWRFDFFAYEHCGFDDALRAIDPAARVLTIPRLDRDPLGAISALRRRLREGGYAVAHSHMTTLSAFALRAAKGAGVPVRVCHAHSTFDRHSDHYLIKAALRPFAAADATVRMACGELAAQNLFGRRAKEAVILPNAIDLERFAPDPQAKARLGLEGRCLLFVGRFAPQKNLPFLLDAFALALRRRPMTLLLLGAGGEEKALRARAAQPDLAGHVRFLPQGDPAPWYAAADAFVLPSLYEGFPVVGLEAQAAGLPCLFSDKITRAADVCGSAAFLPLGREIWAEAMAKDMPRLADGAARLRRAGYDIRQEAGRLCEVYERAVLPFLTDTFLGEEKR